MVSLIAAKKWLLICFVFINFTDSSKTVPGSPFVGTIDTEKPTKTVEATTSARTTMNPSCQLIAPTMSHLYIDGQKYVEGDKNVTLDDFILTNFIITRDINLCKPTYPRLISRRYKGFKAISFIAIKQTSQNRKLKLIANCISDPSACVPYLNVSLPLKGDDTLTVLVSFNHVATEGSQGVVFVVHFDKVNVATTTETPTTTVATTTTDKPTTAVETNTTVETTTTVSTTSTEETIITVRTTTTVKTTTTVETTIAKKPTTTMPTTTTVKPTLNPSCQLIAPTMYNFKSYGTKFVEGDKPVTIDDFILTNFITTRDINLCKPTYPRLISRRYKGFNDISLDVLTEENGNSPDNEFQLIANCESEPSACVPYLNVSLPFMRDDIWAAIVAFNIATEKSQFLTFFLNFSEITPGGLVIKKVTTTVPSPTTVKSFD